MKIFPDKIEYGLLLRTAAMFLWMFITFPFWFLVLVGVWWAREVWSFVWFSVYVSFFLIPIFLFSSWKFKKIAVITLSGIMIFWIFARAVTLSDIQENTSKKIESVFLDGAAPIRYSPWFFFSERDLIRIGSTVILGFFPEGRNKDLYDFIWGSYDQIVKDKDFWGLKSEYIWAFDDMIGIRHDGVHYYRYTPNGGGWANLIVFLHGSVGNFMMYPWMFRELSEKTNSTMAYVSFWYGEWEWEWWIESVKRTIDNELATWKIRHPEAKSNPKITLVALSRGGTGLTRFLKQYPNIAQYIAPISAVLEPEVMNTKEFISSLKNTKVAILHGKQDDNVEVKWAYILEKIARDNHIPVSAIYPDNGDHFIFFDHEKDFTDMIINMWK
jgi:pimeloyl-ACP methyl ester carboxylesterase